VRAAASVAARLSWRVDFAEMKSESELQALARHLYSMRREAIDVPFTRRSIGIWQPAENHCHRNVGCWIQAHPTSRAVRGWMFFDYTEASFFLERKPFVRFTAHSVVEDEDGTLHDITPSRASRRCPFIRHDGSEEEFTSLVEENRVEHLDLEMI
jgi:hypothetical protein